MEALLRGLVLGKLGKAGHKPTLEEARRRFKDHVDGKQVLSADLRSPVCLVQYLFFSLPSFFSVLQKMNKEYSLHIKQKRKSIINQSRMVNVFVHIQITSLNTDT